MAIPHTSLKYFTLYFEIVPIKHKTIDVYETFAGTLEWMYMLQLAQFATVVLRHTQECSTSEETDENTTSFTSSIAFLDSK